MATSTKSFPRRGDIFWVDLRTPRGAEPGNRRPALIVSRDAANKAGKAVMVAPITRTRRTYPEVVELPEAVGRVTGYVHFGQLLTVEKHAVLGRVGRIDSIVQSKVDDALRSALAL